MTKNFSMAERKLRILLVTFGLPYPPDSGVRIHDFYLIKNISRHHSLFLLSLIANPDQVNDVPELSQYCDLVDFVLAKQRSFSEHISGIVRSLFAGRPIATHPFFYDEMASKIRESVKNWDVDIVQIEHSFLAPYVDSIPPASRCRKILSFHNLGVSQYKRMLNLKTSISEKFLFLVKWMLMLRWEAKYAEKCDNSLVVSPLDGELLKSENPNLTVSVIENGIDSQFYHPLPETTCGNTLLFIGVIGYPPNADAVLYFCDSIMPLVQQQIPDVKLIVVGHEPALKICKLAERRNVVVTGYVKDVIPYYQQSQVTIVPLRGGGGTRIKILESMALGRPVVSTSLGCEGLDVIDKENIMIADTPSEFAERVVQLLKDNELRVRISRNARQLVEKHYDWSEISGKLMAVYSDLVAQTNKEITA